MQGVIRAVAAAARRPAGAFARETVFNFFAIFGLALAGFGVWASLGQLESRLWIALGGALASLVLGAWWLSFFATLSEYAGQHGRDLLAADIFAAARRGAGRQRRFTLYLRPFASTNAVQEEVLSAQTFGLAGGLFLATSTHFELEQQIERATRPFGPLIALGEPLEHVGAGRVRVDETNWQEAVALLSDRAELIVLLPSSRPGTLWEVERILNSDLIERTVFIDPPNRVAKDNPWSQSAEWAQVRQAFLKRGYDLPEDSAVGQMLYFGDSVKPRAKARLDVDAEDNIQSFFKRVLRLQRRLAKKKAKEKRA